jgi:hypothetical protein
MNDDAVGGAFAAGVAQNDDIPLMFWLLRFK